MSAPAILLSAQVVAFALLLAAIAAALSALTARSLVVMCTSLAACGASAAAAVLALGAGDAALGLALVSGALAPVMMLAGLLLSARAAKPQKRGPIMAAALAGGAVALAILAGANDFAVASAPPPLRGAAGVWLAALVFVAALGVTAALGYGERGPFGGRREP